MTDIDNTEDVIFYDLEDTSDIAQLERMLEDPDRRWFASKRLASLGRQGITAAVKWDPLLHPRGHDGRFIEVGGWVRWLFDGKWRLGQVLDINEDNGDIRVRPNKDDVYTSGQGTTTFSNADATKNLYRAPKPKAKLVLPDPTKDDATPDWKKVGGQGGSNPGGRFVARPTVGETRDTVSNLTWKDTVGKFGLSPVQAYDAGKKIGKDPETNKIYLRDDSPGDWRITDAQGEEVAIDSLTVDWYTGDKVEDAWSNISAAADVVDGEEFYVKKGKSVDHVQNEVIANHLYELASVPVADVQAGSDPGLLASKIVPSSFQRDDLAEHLNDDAVLKAVRENFVVDAWLANWDVVGFDFENIQIVDGVPYRIDAGGALLYRAQGAPKGSNFGPVVSELDTMRDPTKSKRAGKVFGGITNDELKVGAEKVAGINPEEIREIVSQSGFDESLADTLIARRQYILDHLKVDDPFVVPDAPEPSVPAVNKHEQIKDDILTKFSTSPKMTYTQLINIPGLAGVGGLEIQAVLDELVEDGVLKEWNDSWQTYELKDKSVFDPLGGPGAADPELEKLLAEEEAIEQAAKLHHAGTGTAPHTVHWSSATKSWVPGVQYDTADIDYAMAAVSTIFDQNFDNVVPSTFSFNQYAVEDTYVVDKGRVLKIVGQQVLGTDDYDAIDVQTLKPTTFSVHPSNDGLLVLQGGPVYTSNVIKNYLDAVQLQRDAAVTYQAGIGLSQLMKQGPQAKNLTPDYNTSFDAPEPLIFKASRVDETPSGGLQVGQYLYADGPVFRVTAIDGNDVALKNVVTGSVDSIGIDHTASWLTPTDQHSTEVLDAIIGVDNTLKDAPEAGVPDPSVIEQLDANAIITDVDMDDELGIKVTEPSAVIPDDVMINWFDAYNGIDRADADNSILATFLDEFGYESDSPSVSYASLVGFIENNDLDRTKFDAYLSDKGHKIPDNPPQGDPADTDMHTPTYVDNISNDLQVAEPINFQALDEPEADALAKTLVGTVIYAQSDNVLENIDDEGVIKLQHPTWSGSPYKTVAALGYVESIDTDTGKMKIRLPDGSTSSTTYKNFGHNSLPGVYYPVQNITGDDFKLNKAPVIKADGTIVQNGHVIGAWEQKGYYSWEKSYNYTVFADHSVTGKTMKGNLSKKGSIKGHVQSITVPKPPAPKSVKPKKTNASSKKIATAVASAAPAIELTPGSQYIDGTEVKLGDWVQATKGGLGFVGKVVGWPDQEAHPGLVFAVDNNGIQKILKTKTHKKVAGPSATDQAIADALLEFGTIPSAYSAYKFGDGKTPTVGQKVKAGKAGSEIEGIVTGFNLKQQWVYILTPDGKTQSKTFGVTEVLEEPDLIWDVDSAVAKAAILQEPPKPKNATKVKGGANWPGPDGALFVQAQSLKDEWLAGNPKRKLTKDGYAPKVGMRVRTNKGDEAVVVNIRGEWDANPNGVQVVNLANGKKSWTSTTTLELDHAYELTDFEGNAVTSVSTIDIPDLDTYAPEGKMPDGSTVYRMPVKAYYNGRNTTDYAYVVVPPTGGIGWLVQKDYYGKTKLYSQDLPDTGSALYSWQKVAVIDQTADRKLIVSPHTYAVGATYSGDTSPSPSSIAFADSDGDMQLELAKAKATKDAIAAEEALKEGELPTPKAIDAHQLTTLTPPPPPATTTVATPVQLPKVTGDGKGKDFDVLPDVLKGTSAKSLQAAAIAMIDLKDSKDPDSGAVYGFGGGPKVKDMQYRFNVVQGHEAKGLPDKLQLRFHLTREEAEKLADKMFSGGEGPKKGGYKSIGKARASELTEGDMIAVRVSSTTGLLKPTDNNVPNVKVIGVPEIVGQKSGFDIYLVNVVNDSGEVGQIRVQDRPVGSITRYEWDHEMVIPDPYGNKSKKVLTQEAGAAGWVDTGRMTYPVNSLAVHQDEFGKVRQVNDPQSGLSGANGNGGHQLTRNFGHADESRITFQIAHKDEGGLGADSPRWSGLQGEVRIEVPIDGRPVEEILAEISAGMESVGVSVDEQTLAPSDADIANYALSRFVDDFSPDWEPGRPPVTSPDDPRIAATLKSMNGNSTFKEKLGRNVELSDLRLHTWPSGRVEVVWSPEVATAISKTQGLKYYYRTSTSSNQKASAIRDLGGPITGILGGDERFSLGLATSGMSGHTDVKNGSGGGPFFYGSTGSYVNSGHYLMVNPNAANTSTNYYALTDDGWGKRADSGSGHKNDHWKSAGHGEWIFDKKIEAIAAGYWILEEWDRQEAIKELKARGITHVGSRPIEEVIVTSSTAADALADGSFFKLGLDVFDGDTPITDLFIDMTPVANALGSPAAEPVGVTPTGEF